MKVAILCDSFLPYVCGVTVHTIELATLLLDRGHEVLLFVPQSGSQKNIPPELARSKIVFMPSVKTKIRDLFVILPNIVRVMYELRKFRPDIIESQVPSPHALDGLVASKALKIPYVSTMHSLFISKEYLRHIFKFENPYLEKMSWAYHRWFYNSCTRVFALTEDKRTLLIDHGVEAEKILKIPVLTPLRNRKQLDQNEKRAIREKLTLRQKVALYFGRLSPEKNIIGLLQAWKEAVSQLPNASLLLIGSGSEEEKIRTYIRRNALDTRVILIPQIPHDELIASGIISVADCFVSLSGSEVLSLTFIEALSHGVPLVIVASASYRQLFGDAGIYLTENDIAGFSSALQKILRDDVYAEKLHRAAIDRSKQFLSELLVDTIVESYASAIQSYALEQTEDEKESK